MAAPQQECSWSWELGKCLFNFLSSDDPSEIPNRMFPPAPNNLCSNRANRLGTFQPNSRIRPSPSGCTDTISPLVYSCLFSCFSWDNHLTPPHRLRHAYNEPCRKRYFYRIQPLSLQSHTFNRPVALWQSLRISFHRANPCISFIHSMAGPPMKTNRRLFVKAQPARHPGSRAAAFCFWRGPLARPKPESSLCQAR